MGKIRIELQRREGREGTRSTMVEEFFNRNGSAADTDELINPNTSSNGH